MKICKFENLKIEFEGNFQFSNLSNFQIVSVDRLKPDFLEVMLVTLLFEEQGCPEIT